MQREEMSGRDAAKFILAWVRELDTPVSASAADVASSIKKSFLSLGEKKPPTATTTPTASRSNSPQPTDRPSPRMGREASQEIAALRSLLHELQSVTRAERTAALETPAGREEMVEAEAAPVRLLPGEQHLMADLDQQRVVLLERQAQLLETLREMENESRLIDEQIRVTEQQCAALTENLTSLESAAACASNEEGADRRGEIADEKKPSSFTVTFPSEAELERAAAELSEAEHREAHLRREMAEVKLKHELDLRRARQNLRDWQTHLHALFVEEERAITAAKSPSAAAATRSGGPDESLSPHAQNLTKLLTKLRAKEKMMVDERHRLRTLLRSERNEKKAIASLLRELREPVTVDSPVTS